MSATGDAISAGTASDPLASRERPVLVVGMGVTGCAVAQALADRDHDVILADDQPKIAAARVAGLDVGVEHVHDAGDSRLLARLTADAAAVVPSPGVPPSHLAYTLADAAGVPVVSELDLAAGWDHRPIAAVTGTNGKTTVTALVEGIMNRSGITAVGAGNTDIALVEALNHDVDAFVVEASSFRLHRVRRFAPKVAVWLNLAPDHLDWHQDFNDYAASKARIWAAQSPTDVAVAPFDDESVGPWAAAAPSRLITFASPHRLDAPADVRAEGGVLMARDTVLVPISEMPRRRPHDISNAAAAAAVALEMGACAEAIAAELCSFEGLPHRLAPIGRIGGVCFYDDSKATAPHATIVATAGFTDAVLIAGGRNKGLDLSALAATAPCLRAVVAIGESAPEILASFGSASPEVRSVRDIELAQANSMTEAVSLAYGLAQPAGDVLLSPGCASFDWYSSYHERGDRFIAAVSDLADELDSPLVTGDTR